MINRFLLLQFQIKSLKFLFKVVLPNLILAIAPLMATSYNFEVNRLFDDCELDLHRKIDLTLDLALKKYDGQKIWLIYSIDCFTSADNSLKHQKSKPGNLNLTQLIYGKFNHKLTEQKKYANYTTIEKSNQSGKEHKLKHIIDKDKNKLAIILDYSLESGNPCLYQVCVQNINQSFFKEMRPIFWLGGAIPSASINWLGHQYEATNYQKLQQQIIAAIGAHHTTQQVVGFLKQVLVSNCNVPLKIDAIHFLGKHNSVESIRLLTFLAVKQNNKLLRKKAIFALSQVNEKTAKNVVNALASKANNPEVQQEAIFWLSQIADEDALKTLNKILTKEENSTIKNYTLFVISQLPESKSIPILFHIAENNPDERMRSRAKFWLDRTKGQRIMDFIKELDQEDVPDVSN